MRRWVLALAGVAVLTSALLAAGAPAGAQTGGRDRSDDSPRVLVITIPTLRWEDVVEHQPAHFLRLMSRSAVASMSLRTIGVKTTLGEAYATLGAGNRAGVDDDANLALPPDGLLDDQRASDIFRRRTGISADGAAALHLTAAKVEAKNDRLLYDTRPGLLAETLGEAERTVAVVGNADVSPASSPLELRRELTLAGMLPSGYVVGGDISATLLRDDPQSPLGVRLDPVAMEAATTAAVAEHDVTFVELSDLWRADEFAVFATEDRADEAWDEAVRATDDLLGRVVETVDLDRDLVILLSPVSELGPEQLTVGMMAGAGVEPGLLRSGTTRRAGYVTLPDVAPTIVEFFDLDIPTDMTGAPMSSAGGDAPSLSTAKRLVEDNRMALFRNRATGPLTVALIVIQVVGYLLAALVLARRADRWRRALSVLVLATLSVPVITFLSGLFDYRTLGVGGYAVAVFATATVLAVLAMGVASAAGRRGVGGAHLIAPSLVAGLTGLVLLVDIAVGAPLQIDTPFGYGGGAIVAGRFSGYGNLAWAVLVACLIVAATGVWGLRRYREPDAADRRWIVAVTVVFAVAIVAIGMPGLGLNVGGTLSAVPGLVVVLIMLTGRRVTARRALLVGAGTVGALAVFGALDLLRPAESQTHLGRLLTKIGDQGIDGFSTVLERKLAANYSILTSSVWALLIPASLLFLIFLTVRPPSILRQLEERVPGLRECLVGTLVVGVLGALLNDSGIAIPAIMLVIVLPYVSFLALYHVVARR